MYHVITIVGNLGNDPELRFTSHGDPVASFSVASNRSYTDKSGEKHQETTWFRVTAWGKLAELCNQYLGTGSQVFIEGKLSPDKATGGPRIWGEDGDKRASYEVLIDTIKFLGKRDGGSNGSHKSDVITKEEIPF